jgi:hypothetical protein
VAKIIQLDQGKEAIERAIQALEDLSVRQIVVCVEFSDRTEEVMFYGRPKEIFKLLALAQFQIGFRYPLANWHREDAEEED